MKKIIPIISIALLALVLLSIWFYPTASAVLGSISLLLCLAISFYTIIQTHKGTENVRPKILKEVSVVVLTLIVIIFFGGLAGLFTSQYAGAYVESHWQGYGVTAGFIAAILVSFILGYFVRRGVGKLSR